MKKFFIYLFIFFTVFWESGLALPSFVFAAEINSVNEFDKTEVMSDLLSSTVDGVRFNVADYPYDVTGTRSPTILLFAEYAYSFKVNQQGSYGLYVYVYNPAVINIDTASLSNKIQIAVGYNAEGIPDNYEKFDLRFLLKSKGVYAGLFYKFRVVDRASYADGKTILSRITASVQAQNNGGVTIDDCLRRYDVSGIELATVENANGNVTDYKVGGSYEFKGYAHGLGADPDADSTLLSAVNDLETITFDQLHRTNYRTGVSSLGLGHQWNVDTVYFSVPNYFLEKYGKLQKIKAEWWEYKTKEMIVTQSTVLRDYIESRLGVPTSEQRGDGARSIYANLYHDISGINYPNLYGYDWSWNADFRWPLIGVGPVSDLLYYIFYQNNIDIPLSGSELESYVKSYNKTAESGYLPIKNQSISADLFQSDVDSGRTKGYNLIDVDSDDLFDFFTYDSNNPTWWDKVLDFGLWNYIQGNIPDLGGGQSNVTPIYPVTAADMLLDNTALSNRLLINSFDVGDLRNLYASSVLADETVFLFRFAVTDYYSAPLTIVEHGPFRPDDGDEAYMAIETVFFDFDIIQFTFNKDGVYRVIPVVSSPIDIINDLTPPLKGEGVDCLAWLKLILSLVFLIVIIVLIAPFLPTVFTFLIKLIIVPIKFLGSLFKNIKRSFKKRK
jgi:hypothetical protein